MNIRWSTSGSLREEISARNRLWAEAPGSLHAHETTFGQTQHVIYSSDDQSEHGNFLPVVYKRILTNPQWARRLEKTYTASARVPRAGDRKRRELECATSSDALLMNVFCYPGVLRRSILCALLGVEPGATPEFGIRALLPMRNGETDRTEIDLRLDGLLAEAKLTEGGFGIASRERLMRYEGVEDIFDLKELPWTRRGVIGYQIIRGLLAAVATESRFAVLCDGRRADLRETCLSVARAVRSSELHSQLLLITWQEIAATLSPSLQKFLAEKYGICPHVMT